jgi:hypothetical protein
MNKNKYSENLEKIIKAIQIAAERTGLHPSEISQSHVLKYNDNVTSWMIRLAGGISTVKSAHFPIVSKDLVTIREQKETAAYIKQLENKLAKIELFGEQIQKQVNEKITPIKIKPYVSKLKTPKKQKRNIIAMLNDVHYGLKVDPEEVGGLNKFSWVEACRRTAYFTKQLCDYKIDKRDEVETIHIILNGDMIQGMIHDLTARTAELLIHQVNGTIHILGHMIATVASNYKKVVVHGVSGNHDDAVHRREGGRVTSHKYDSYTNVVYYSLSAMFKNEKNISFNFPKSLYGTIDLPAGRIAFTHGDTIFSTALGNPGRTLNTRLLGDELSRFNAGEIEKGNPRIRAFLFGHVHSHTELTTYDGTKVIIAPSLSGIDSFAASITINHNQVGQLFFESTEDYIAGDKRLVELIAADKDDTLDLIIPTYKNELSWQK